MLIRDEPGFRASEITDERLYLNRRAFIRAASAALAAAGGALAWPAGRPALAAQTPLAGFRTHPPGPYRTDEKLNTFEEITSYNNFYEFGSDKSDPQRHADRLTTRPWTIKVVDTAASRPTTMWRISSARTHWRSACTGCAASKPGQW